jgi:hypothetical protein
MTNSTSIIKTDDVYDHQGAALYIAVILIWYSTGLAMMLFLQVRPRSLQQQFLFEPKDLSNKQRLQTLATNRFSKYRNIQTDNNTKQILNELKDPERRQRLWKIYYASSDKHNEPYPQYYQTITSDTAAIDRIKRKLAAIHQVDTNNTDDSIAFTSIVTPNNDNRLSSTFDSTKFFTKRFPNLLRPTGNILPNSRLPLSNVQSQLESLPLDTSSIQMRRLSAGNTACISSNNSSRKRANILNNRFKIEKVDRSNADALNTTTAELE